MTKQVQHTAAARELLMYSAADTVASKRRQGRRNHLYPDNGHRQQSATLNFYQKCLESPETEIGKPLRIP